MIRIPQVRVVDEEGAQLGVMPTPQALEMAQERGLDLVEVAPMASPPVVKFLDFGQYKYELTKREKEAKRKQRSVTFKEVRLSPKIGVGDFDTKVHRAIEFLEDGDRIKVTVRFRGRELTHPEIGRNLLARFVGPSQGSRGPGTDPAARRQVDAHHDGIDPQAQGPRWPGPTRATGPTARSMALRRRRQPDAGRSRTGDSRRGRDSATGAGRTGRPKRRPKPKQRPKSEPKAEPAAPAPSRAPAAEAGSGRQAAASSQAAAAAAGRSGDQHAAPAADEDRRQHRPRAGRDRRVRRRCRRSRATRPPRSASA